MWLGTPILHLATAVQRGILDMRPRSQNVLEILAVSLGNLQPYCNTTSCGYRSQLHTPVKKYTSTLVQRPVSSFIEFIST